MSSKTHPERVRYFTGQFLQAGDLEDDQNYHRHMRWRHNLALHSWGIVSGLELNVKETRVTVSAGMALDGYGRELVLAFPEQQSMSGRSESEAWDVWLLYRSREVPPNSRRDGCSSAREPERQQERPQIHFSPRRQLTTSDPSRPNEVPPGDLNFGPNDPMPAGQDQQWPVFLGKLIWLDGRWQADASERRYAGLIAERIIGPKQSGDEKFHAEVINGHDSDLPQYQFAVVERPNKNNQQNEAQQASHDDKAGSSKRPWLAIRETSDGEQIEWNASRAIASGDISMRDGAALEFLPTPLRQKVEGEKDRWLMYHHYSPPELEKAGEPEPTYSDELRINMPRSTDISNGKNSVVIGTRPPGEDFLPILRIRENQTVEVYGELRVNGHFEGTASNAHPGTPPGGTDAALGIALEILDTVLTKDVENVVNIQKRVIEKLIEKDRATHFAEALVLNVELGEPVAKQIWATEDWRKAIGKHAAVQELDFTQFLDSLPQPANMDDGTEFHHVTPIGKWLLKELNDPHDQSQKLPNPYIRFLPRTFPINADQASLKKFAEVFNEDGNAKQLNALLDALLKEFGQGGTTAAKLQVAQQVGVSFPRKIEHARSFLKGTIESSETIGTGQNNSSRIVQTLFEKNGGPQAVSSELTKLDPTKWPPVSIGDLDDDDLLGTFLRWVKENNPSYPEGNPLIDVLGNLDQILASIQ